MTDVEKSCDLKIVSAQKSETHVSYGLVKLTEQSGRNNSIENKKQIPNPL